MEIEQFIDKSVTLKLRATDGKMYDTIVLNMKDVMEISVCHERNKDSLDKFSRGFQIETASLSHVAGGAWNATPFWQPKIPPRKDVHSVDALCIIR